MGMELTKKNSRVNIRILATFILSRQHAIYQHDIPLLGENVGQKRAISPPSLPFTSLLSLKKLKKKYERQKKNALKQTCRKLTPI